ncbi:metallophosphoesterase [Acidiferrimicrobium sp. IK]|uniref:metallophosphoesterase family protein n=1 Tax=Acidiferrimicrobium sp. IK TaxID=2871700 RepID=UPI0021CB30E0|nr:metallophosphoesterase [Acidiferrimicrobium sp. IK]MCU4186602.1 metallophosphoesterase [Acidiferrimicrobium sp. IK]
MAKRLTKKRVMTGVAVTSVSLATLVPAMSASAHYGRDTADNAWPYAAAPGSPVLAAVGDISCQPDANSAGQPGEAAKPGDTCTQANQADAMLRNQAQAATADQVESMKPDLVAILGDEQYQVGTLADFEGSYDQTYGAFKFLQRPSPGNHEFYSTHGQNGEDGIGYFDYFNGYQLDPATGQPKTELVPLSTSSAPRYEPVPRPSGQAGQSGQGWYSYDLGSWHIISLNAECSIGDNAATTSCAHPPAWYQQETQWLAQDLSTDHASCTLAYWHQPTFSASNAPASATVPGPGSGEGTAADAWWQLLSAHGADLVLNGHEHLYARFAPMNAAGHADKHGIREFIVGTGGEGLDPLHTTASGQVAVPNLQSAQGSGDAFQNGTTTSGYPGAFGAMKLTLGRDGYSWDYASAPAPTVNGAPAWASFSDTGSASCHGPAHGG